jgi:DNA-binding MarR family transcriptional regulator
MGAKENRGVAEAEGDLTSFMRAVGSLNRSLLAVGDSIAGAAGQTRARSECLQQIGEQPRTVASIATRLEMTRQSVQRVADLLVEDGLATYEDNPSHRRAKLLVLTATGRRALIAMREAHQGWVESAAAELDTAALNEVTSQLLDILAAVKRMAVIPEGPRRS